MKRISDSKRLPEDILRGAFISGGSGECAWRKKDLLNVTEKLAAQQIMILGGEVWMVRDEKIHGMLMLRGQDMSSVFGWTTREGPASEEWSIRCARSARETREALVVLDVENSVNPADSDFLWYNLTLKWQGE